MPWHWLALVAERPTDALAAASAYDADGRPAGVLAAWPADRGRPAGGLGIDVRAVDPQGEAAWISLALAPPGLQLLFDDPAVCWALRQVLAGPARLAVSTLTLDLPLLAGRSRPRVNRLRSLWRTIRSPGCSRLACCASSRASSAACHGRSGQASKRYAGSPWPWDRFPLVTGVIG